MTRSFGRKNSFFAFYHSDQILDFFFAAPWHGDQYYFPKHPSLHRRGEAFIEPSAYRDRYRKRPDNGSWRLPSELAWGITILGAQYFVNKEGEPWPDRDSLPPVAHVLAKGRCFQDFLVALAACELGENLAEAVFVDRLVHVLSAEQAVIQRFAPQWLLGVEFVSPRRRRSLKNLPWRPGMLGELLGQPGRR